MKFIIIGLGNFGAAMARKLTQTGHEVVGVDINRVIVESIKDDITYAIALDCRQEQALKNLPLLNTDIVVVCIGEDEGANLLVTAMMKKLNVPRVISRSVSSIHETILEAMEITEIIRPEEETAERWAVKLTTSGIVDTFPLTDKYSITQVKVPSPMHGKTIEEIGFNKNFSVVVLTILKNTQERNFLGIFRKSPRLEIQGIASASTVLTKGDIMVLYGHNDNIRKLVAM
jgi:trk system potassium uptake protein TrkA